MSVSEMKVTFPYMGNIYIPLRAIIDGFGFKTIVPPAPNQEILALGAKLSPELICIPFKVTLGNLLVALKMGADTIAHTSGNWSCRFGYYQRIHRDILKSLGFNFQTIVLRRDGLKEIYNIIKKQNCNNTTKTIRIIISAIRRAWYKSHLMEFAEDQARKIRPYEIIPGSTTKVLNHFLKRIDRTNSIPELKAMREEVRIKFARIKRDETRSPLRIKIVGESYCVIEPFINFNLIEKLGNMGVYCDPFLTAHKWVGFHSIRLGMRKKNLIEELARPYWKYNVGGEDMNTIGHTVLAAKEGFDGVIHLHPFACMPATISQPVLEKISRDYDIPYLPISLDEHTAETGFYTRIDAFISLLEKRRKISGSH